MSKKDNDKKTTNNWMSEQLSSSAKETCQNALKLLNKDQKDDIHSDIHEVRQHLKKNRALLRLVRDTNDNYGRENKFYRDEARKIAPLRHAEAKIEALDLIQQQYNERIYKKAFVDIRTQLEENRDQEVEKALTEKHILQDMYQNLEPKCEKMDSIFKGSLDFKTIGSGIKRVYRRGKKAHTKAMDSKSASNLHELKKRITYLQYQLGAINTIWPKVLNAWQEELNELSAYLSSYRDLTMLHEYLEENNKESDTEDGAYLLGTLIAGHRDQLRKHAILLGKKLYHLSAKDFVALLEVAWESHEAGMNKKLLPSDKLER
ncbi:CHAD domain-containing protein [Flavimarina sp. Hel_I_48]|uniref:CHAD domain-containing protein n=1 Tax=Flavimarina sp. Hel_I_48 TaxID=1392488 RepID=UPI0004DFBF1B|nr:CHAD domain-containing protein [Flavimarina sp. Hel_I_48]